MQKYNKILDYTNKMHFILYIPKKNGIFAT